MNKEKQIEEMRKAMIKEMTVYLLPPDNEIRAKLLYDAGYGDTKEAVKEFAEKLKEKVEKAEEEIVPKGCDSYFKNGAMCCQSIIFLILDDLVKEVCGEK